jgi:hypothetical protein
MKNQISPGLFKVDEQRGADVVPLFCAPSDMVLPTTGIAKGSTIVQDGILKVFNSHAWEPNVFPSIADAPTAAVYASAETAMTGGNNNWELLSAVPGEAGNLFSLEVVVEPFKFDEPDVSISSEGAVVITAGDKARMEVTGSLTSDGITQFVFPIMSFEYEMNGYWAYRFDDVGDIYFVRPAFSVDTFIGWEMGVNDTVMYTSAEDVTSPDLVSAWSAESPADGAPTVTSLTHSAAQCKTVFDGSSAGDYFTLTDADGNDGTGAVEAHGPVSLTGGLDGDAFTSPIYLKSDGSAVYLVSSAHPVVGILSYITIPIA